MRISARNVLEGTVKEVKKGATTSHVLIDVKPLVNVAWLIKTWWLRRRDGFVEISVSVVRFKRSLRSRLEMPLAA